MRSFLLLLLLSPAVTAQSIWSADFVQSKPGRQPQTLRYFEQNWAAARQQARQAGYVGRYQLLQAHPDSASKLPFDIILLTEYPSPAVYEQREANFQAIFRQRGPTKLPDGIAPVEMRDIRLSGTFVEPIATPTTDAALEATLNDCLEGGTIGDTARVIRAFHPSATMKYIDNATGQFNDVPIADYLNRIRAGAGKRTDRTTRIAHYERTGTTAQARVEMDYPTFRFIDYFNLLQINGRWQIVSKIFYRQAK